MGYLSTGTMLKTVGVCGCTARMCRALVHQPRECFGSKVVMVKNNNYRQITSKYECGNEAVKLIPILGELMRELLDRVTSKQQQQQQQ